MSTEACVWKIVLSHSLRCMWKAQNRRHRYSETGYIPSASSQNAPKRKLHAILDNDTADTEKALTAFLWGARGQLFWDGNKRTSMTVANKILISAGAGILTITDKHMEQFNTLLLDYYNTGEGEQLKLFLYDNCIQGIDL